MTILALFQQPSRAISLETVGFQGRRWSRRWIGWPSSGSPVRFRSLRVYYKMRMLLPSSPGTDAGQPTRPAPGGILSNNPVPDAILQADAQHRDTVPQA